MSIKNFIKGIVDGMSERATSPFLFTLAIVFFVFNSEIIIKLFFHIADGTTFYDRWLEFRALPVDFNKWFWIILVAILYVLFARMLNLLPQLGQQFYDKALIGLGIELKEITELKRQIDSLEEDKQELITNKRLHEEQIKNIEKEKADLEKEVKNTQEQRNEEEDQRRLADNRYGQLLKDKESLEAEYEQVLTEINIQTTILDEVDKFIDNSLKLEQGLIKTFTEKGRSSTADSYISDLTLIRDNTRNVKASLSKRPMY